ncbi:MAG: PAS domain S-box protein [Gaiellaceae bacterium MAG52_C11]|nr:PAS domain S-box protein [Candidatus Gaiellasilicea maunaloa]
MNERMDETDFRAIVEELPLVVYVDALDARSTPIYVSSQIENLLGYTAAEWQADPDLYVRSLHADDRERVLEEIAARNRGEVSPGSHDYRLFTRDGSLVWVRDEEVVVRDAAGVPIQAQGYLQDVTERRQQSMRLELLVQILALAAEDLSPSQLVERGSKLLAGVLGRVSVTYVEIGPGQTGKARYSTDPDARLGEIPVIAESLRRLEHGPIVVDDVLEEDWLEPVRGILAAADVRSAVDIPLRRGGSLAAALWFNAPEPRRWTVDEVLTLTEMAEQLAVLLQSAEEREQRRRAERELLRREAILEAVSLSAAQLLAEPDWRTVAPLLLERVGTAVGASRAYLFENALDPIGGLVSSERFEWAAEGVAPQLENELMQEMSFADVGLGRLEQVVGSDRVFSAVVSRLPESERSLFVRQRIKSLIAVPIVVDGVSWGFLGFDDCEHEREWAVTESEAFRLAASLVAAAVQRRGSETTLREQEQKLRAVFETSVDAVVIMDDDRRFLDVNPGACNLFGRDKDDLVGRSIDDFLPPEELERVATDWESLRTTDSEFRDRHVLRADGSQRQVEGSLSAHVLPGLHIGFIRDVTERKQLEAELLSAQKLESIGRLAGGVAHDFNNLLTAISGYTSLLLERTHGDVELAHDLGEIRRAAERAAELTSQLLAFGRRQVLQPRAVDLNEVLTEIGSLLLRLLGEHIELELRPAPALGAVRVDPGQIEQVIVNLAVNARDAMPDGGRLTISTRARELETGPGIELEVADTGVGMDEQTKAQVFEPFFTTRAKGNGLGLATVYGIVSQSGGAITVESRPGEGSTFRIRLPRVSEQPAPPEPAPEQLDETGSETILLVEDEDVVRTLAQRVLERCGYTVIACANGSEAIELAERDSRRIDLLLTDVVMPGLRGPEVAARVAASRPAIEVLYMSGYADQALLGVAAFDESALIAKPFAVDALAHRVREALGSRVENGARMANTRV